MTNTNETATPRRPWKTAVATAAFLTLGGFGVYQHNQTTELRSEISQMRETMQHNIRSVETKAAAETDAALRDMEALRAELDAARQQASRVAGQARVQAQKHAETLAKQLSEKQEQVRELMAQQVDAIKTETSEKFSEVNSNVEEVESKVTQARTEIEKTVADLRRVTGDMGIMSGRIATNHDELMALKRLGEREYFEFAIDKKKKNHKVGDVLLTLKKVDTKRNRFTFDLLADDKRIEKKDKTLNEPVQFYMSGVRQPVEIVV